MASRSSSRAPSSPARRRGGAPGHSSISERPTADWLALLDYGTFEVAEDARRIPIRGYVVRSGEHVVLVDTGFPDAYYENAEESGRRDGLDAFGRLVSIGAHNRPQAQLALLGLTTGDVTELVLTHGDIDHIGGMHHFPEARLVMSRVERQAGPPRYYADLRPLEWPEHTHARLVDGDEEIARGVTLLATPGHSPGHLSLLVELAETGAVILACDAISREHELATGVNGGASDNDAARTSAQRLVDLAHDRGGLLVYGHDPEQSRTLRCAPQTYQ